MWFLVIKYLDHDYHGGGEIVTVRTVVGKRGQILDWVEKLGQSETAIAYGPLSGDTVLDNFESLS